MLTNNYNGWLFDMDGTLTIPSHDFNAVRLELGMPENVPILEHLATLPASESQPLHQRLQEIEWQHARDAVVDPAAVELLTTLRRSGKLIGLVTRNSKDIALETLRVCGLTEFFVDGSVIAREDATPKPAADGIQLVLDRLNINASSAIMVGDYIHDLAAGRAAGTDTIWIDHAGDGRFNNHANYVFSSLDHVLRHRTD